MNDDDELEEWEDTKTLEERMRSGPLLRILLWTALSAGAVWVVLNAIVQIRTARGYANLFSSEGAATVGMDSSGQRYRLQRLSRCPWLLRPAMAPRPRDL
jgi:hypothetical protein